MDCPEPWAKNMQSRGDPKPQPKKPPAPTPHPRPEDEPPDPAKPPKRRWPRNPPPRPNPLLPAADAHPHRDCNGNCGLKGPLAS